MFCTSIFAVLLLKYCFSTGDQLKDIALQICFTVAKLPNGMNEQTRRHVSGMMSLLACIADNTELNFFYIHEMAI